MQIVSDSIVNFSNWVWGYPLLFLLIGGGLFFLIYSGLAPFKYFKHAINILRGKYDDPKDPGQIKPYQALSTALASTVGMGNIAGVAVAISMGGPGAIFWMWISAFVGMATNFFTCSAAIMFRGKDSRGDIQGGPMYVIVEGLGKNWRPLAVVFSFCCMFGALPIFQANQLTQAIVDIAIVPAGYTETYFHFLGTEFSWQRLGIGLILTFITGIVVIGGIKRIGNWAGQMVPVMIVLYFISVMTILILNYDQVPRYLVMIVSNAFTADNFHGEPDALFGGIVGALIILGVRRASFSNEAGIGTAPMALGASKSREPIREGLVAMLSPAIDTLLVCTLTALAILVTGVWETSASNGVSLTATAFESSLPYGQYILMMCIFFFSVTSLFSYCYYGTKSLSFIIGAENGEYYKYFYLFTVIVGAVSSMSVIISLIDAAYAIMAVPTMLSGLLLAPKVKAEALRYFASLKK
jgi:alanine or glycine:cation symporter, AGCS family